MNPNSGETDQLIIKSVKSLAFNEHPISYRLRKPNSFSEDSYRKLFLDLSRNFNSLSNNLEEIIDKF